MLFKFSNELKGENLGGSIINMGFFCVIGVYLVFVCYV